jgi:hypothetical protein
MKTKYFFSLKILFSLIISYFLFATNADAQTTFSHGIASSPSLVWFKPDTNIAWVDVHFDIGSGVQNLRMKANTATGRFEQTLNATTGTVIKYSFTYSIDGFVGFDTGLFNATFGGTSSSINSASVASVAQLSSSSESVSSTPASSSTSSNSSAINTITHGVDDHNTFVIAWLKPNSLVVEWADIHFKINNGVQQNVRMTFNTANARFEQIINTTNDPSLSIAYSFTHQTLQGAVDTSLFNFSRAPGSSASSSAQSSNVQSSVSSSSSLSSVSSVVTNVDRSLLVHDQATLQAADFSFRSTLQQLTNQFNAQNPANPTTVEELFSRWWDTQTPTPGNVSGGEKCTGQLNGFAVECRQAEGSQANNPSFFINGYIPIALINRFDLRDNVNFKDCGEHRVIYASTSGLRNFIIFEAQLPNPTPGVASGCLTIAQFWKNLSAEDDATARATKLRNFYFQGIPSANVRAVIDIRNYTFGTGQIRANMFMGSSWDLKEFKTTTDSQGLSMIVPVTVKSNPVAFLFDGNNTDVRTSAFQTDFINNLGSLLGDFDIFSLTVEKDAHNNGQSHASGDVSENAFSSAFFNTNTNNFQQALTDKLVSVGSTLTPAQVMNRATAMTCGGCHEPGTFGLTAPDAIGPGQNWPTTLGFTHVSEFANGGVFPLSPALTDVFLPTRLNGLNSFISSASALNRSTSLNISTTKLNSNLNSSSTRSAPSKPFHKRAG